MDYPPKGFEPSTPPAIRNGRPCYADDPMQIDLYSAWLASVMKPQIPAIITPDPMTSGPVYKVELIVPPYTAAFGMAFLVHGRGSIAIISEDDTWNADTGTMYVGDKTVHTLAEAQWVWLDEVMTGVLGDGSKRALETDILAGSDKIIITWQITDAAFSSLYVYDVKFWWFAQDDSATLVV